MNNIAIVERNWPTSTPTEADGQQHCHTPTAPVPPGHVIVRRGAVRVVFPERAKQVIDAYEKKQGCDRVLLERAHGRTMAELLRVAETKAGKADRNLGRQVARKRAADANFLQAAGTTDFKAAVALAKAFAAKLDGELQAARRSRTARGPRPTYDDMPSTGVWTVSGGLPTLGRGHR